ncbi:peritrophin-48-like [Chironomus tepperi]|uniref:peritrophin-48-like n=1 Tax=Chironomus tepperi TaxID=113505 RepID=UPI00391F7A8F
MKILLIFIAVIVKFQSSAAQIIGPVCQDNKLQWLPHPTDCSRYYVCQNSILFPRSCAPGLLFNNLSGQCRLPQFSFCALSCPLNDQPSNLVFLPDFHDCSRYFICDSGRAISRGCADGLLFDANNNWCDFPTNVDCESRGNGTILDPVESTTSDNGGDDLPAPSEPPTAPPTTTTPRTTVNPDRFQCPVTPGIQYFHHTLYCYKYFKCHNGISYLRECPEGLFFDYFERTCKENAICYSPELTTAIPEQ